MNPTFRNILIFVVLVIAGILYVNRCQPEINTVSQSNENSIKYTDEPYQKKIKKSIPFKFKGLTITPLAEYKIKARVLSRHRYTTGKEAKISPMDLALGWGRMADPNIIKDIHISQWGRWYYWKTKKFPIPRREIETHSANTHIIPANNEVYKTLKKIKKGDIIYLEGKLVRVNGKNWYWQSSMSRKDTGGGSCELVWTEKLEIY